ncbi:MAG: hypothetical protein NTW01_06200 [Gammaproteobacteria bacterium]|jgi:hypothetical protein|uniref:hypothetical protein n=1 Tax=Nevskia sp. TaxID=1929292 RepID=UPI004036C177|nr:hypothetical protein [Gammaproteobacteria bacterium]
MGDKVNAVIERVRAAGSALAAGVGQSGRTTVDAVRLGAGLQLGLAASVGSAVEDQWQAAGKIRDTADLLQSQRKFGEALYDSTLNYFDGLREAGFSVQAGWLAAANTVAAGFGLTRKDH